MKIDINIPFEDLTDDEQKYLLENNQYYCSNKLCKKPYTTTRKKYFYNNDNVCHTCKGNDGMNGGIKYTDNQYEGSRHDEGYHQVAFRFSEFKNGQFWNHGRK